MNSGKIIAQLTDIVGKDRIHIDEKSKQIYGKDLTQQFNPDPLQLSFQKIHRKSSILSGWQIPIL
jgi:hypothetical protein